MISRFRIPPFLTLIAILLCGSATFAYMSSSDYGTWPDTWPQELGAFRKQAKTYDFASGTNETVYEIPFDSLEEFEKAWPYIASLKSNGAPLVLEKSPSSYRSFKLAVGVRILTPPRDALYGSTGGKPLSPGPPWPDSAKLARGDLPEYVKIEDGKWVPAEGEPAHGRLVRARQDVILVCDGEIIDINRIALPPNTPIIDRRFEEQAGPSHAD